MNPDRGPIRISKATLPVAFFFGALRTLAASAVVLCLLVQTVLAGDWRVRVEKVLDGDTVALDGGERLRLRGIDAPEVGHKGTPGQYYGLEATEALATLVAGKTIALDRDELDRDRYGRLVGLARLDDGRLVNLAMIEQGAAFVYPHHSDGDAELGHRLLQAQVAAMTRGKGFWPALLRSAAAERGYLGNRNSRRFHALSCAQGRTVGTANQVRFSSLSEAFAAGFAPARECTPWPVERGR
ncbi:MAG TPA: nuclease [Desulfomicrobium sp.]|nr:nuclease [Desulfomicrobium sp.]